jgi:competence protein ComEA
MNKKYITIGITCGLLIIAGVSYCISMNGCNSKNARTSSLSENGQYDEVPENISPAVPSETASVMASQVPEQFDEDLLIYVHICGAVVNPGVYQIKAGSRVCDLIELSGGLTKAAAGDYMNQAESVTDGQRIYIPTKEEIKDLTTEELVDGDQSASEDNDKASGLVNINTATAEELMTLPGIGQAKADSIITYRNTNGNFKLIEDLMNITGIKEGVFNRISSYITV